MFKSPVFAMLALFPCLLAAGTMADPLRPEGMVMVGSTTAMAASKETPRLSMIVRNSRQRHAVIDEQTRQVGERWDGYRVLAIHPASVVLGREGGEPLELGLLPGAAIKKNLRP